MPEENWAAHGGVQACDLCHSRKVKCDRQDPCANCVAAKSECLRNRHKRTSRPKVRTEEKIQALVSRLSTLEDSVRSTHRSPSITAETAINNTSSTVEPSASPERPLKRKRTESLANGRAAAVAPPSEPDPTQQSATEARSLISRELSTNGLLSPDQRLVLEKAISFVDHLSHAPVPTITDRSTFDRTMYGSTPLSRGEILHVILGTGVRQDHSSAIDINSLDHIPPKAVEKIGLALMEGTADDRTLSLYKVIIHFKAAVVLYASHLEGSKSAGVQSHIKQMEFVHMSAALTALDSVSFLTPPSLLLVQALITGGMMMQIIGNPASCWELIAHASRTIVALGYHNIVDPEPRSELDDEIHAVVAWCAQFDSVMSLLLLRPRSLPPLNVPASSLMKPDPANPMCVFEILSMELVPVYDKILDLTLELNAKRSIPSLRDEVAWLRSKMSDIFRLMERERPTHLLDSNQVVLLHWRGLEFKYYSTLASVHRLSPSVTTVPAEREECLRSARTALECVLFIETIGRKLGHFIEGYDPYLAWTMLSYPLCPFFVVFCNVVGTSNAQDFQLLQDVTDGISELVSENKFVNRLHRLCSTLLELCKPLIQTPAIHGRASAPTVSIRPVNSNTIPTEADSQQMMVSDANGNVDDFLNSSWQDDRMWQLFQSQPSLDWFNADILDPAWGDFGLAR
ncbi:putative Zn(II)2Cys6 transcription factor-like protein [Ophiobolus disseminans]|uniref:Putative Zn(II)2Cys6 transcription factor-like protein n=1 Tax=Ophiobolus disseminans TaxID=1469910 RepID=A0A6A6ZWL2_9PLEO|nr:putative Zn(II)2Cys6 transcription factor-like protein [Ophiobolus disseminans]